jgi:hypothetical protein
MTVTSIFKFRNKNGTELTNISLVEWVNTLPEIEQDAFFAAKTRQQGNRQKAIDSKYLIVDHLSTTGRPDYIWPDEDTRTNNNHGADLIWLSYFNRWLEDTQQEFIIEVRNSD